MDSHNDIYVAFLRHKKRKRKRKIEIEIEIEIHVCMYT